MVDGWGVRVSRGHGGELRGKILGGWCSEFKVLGFGLGVAV